MRQVKLGFAALLLAALVRSVQTDAWGWPASKTWRSTCDDAAEDCPLWLGKGRRTHIGFIDPAKASGTPEEKVAVFRTTRDEMRGIEL